MAEGDGFLYNDFKEQLMLGELDLVDDTVKMILVSGHTPNIDTHAGYADVSADEVAGTGYTAGGATLGTPSVTQDNTNDRAAFDGDNILWTGLELDSADDPPSHAIMYDSTHASDKLLAHWIVTTRTNGGNYTLAFDASGIILLS